MESDPIFPSTSCTSSTGLLYPAGIAQIAHVPSAAAPAILNSQPTTFAIQNLMTWRHYYPAHQVYNQTYQSNWPIHEPLPGQSNPDVGHGLRSSSPEHSVKTVKEEHSPSQVLNLSLRKPKKEPSPSQLSSSGSSQQGFASNTPQRHCTTQILKFEHSAMTFGAGIYMAESVVPLDVAATPNEPADSSSANNKLNKLVSPGQLPRPSAPKLPEGAWTSTGNSSGDEWMSSQQRWMQHERPSAPARPATPDTRNPQDVVTPVRPTAPPNLSTLSPLVSKSKSPSPSRWPRYDEPPFVGKIHTDPGTPSTTPDCMKLISPCIDWSRIKEEVYSPSRCTPCTMVSPSRGPTRLLSHSISSLIAPQRVECDKCCCSKLEAGVQTEDIWPEDNGLEILSCIAGHSSNIPTVSESRKGPNGMEVILQAASYLVLEEHLSAPKVPVAPPKSEYHIESSEPAAASPSSKSPDLEKNYNVVKNVDKGCRQNDSAHPSLPLSSPGLIMNATELKTRLEMADVQLKYKEKQRQLAQIPRSRKKRLMFSKRGRASKSSPGSLSSQSKLSPVSNPLRNIFGSKSSVDSGLVSESVNVSPSVLTAETAVFHISPESRKFSAMSDDVFLPGPRSGISRLNEPSDNSENAFLPKRVIHGCKLLSSNTSGFSDRVSPSKSGRKLSSPTSSREKLSSLVNLPVVSKKSSPFEKSTSSKAFGQLDNVAQLHGHPDLILSSAFSELSDSAAPLKSSFRINNAATSKSSFGIDNTASSFISDIPPPLKSSFVSESSPPLKSSFAGDSSPPLESPFGSDSSPPLKSTFGSDSSPPLKSTFGSDSAAPSKSTFSSDSSPPLKSTFGSDSAAPLKSSFASDSTAPLKSYFVTDSTTTSKSPFTMDKGVPSMSSKSHSVCVSPSKCLTEPSQSLHIFNSVSSSSPVVSDVPSTLSSVNLNSQSLSRVYHTSKVSLKDTCSYEECKNNGSQQQTKFSVTDDKSRNFSFCSTSNLPTQTSAGSESSINCAAVSFPSKYTFSNNHSSHERLSCWTSSSEKKDNKRKSPQTADSQQKILGFSVDSNWRPSARKRLKLEQEPASFHELACLAAQQSPDGKLCEQISEKSPKALHKAGQTKGVLNEEKNGKTQIKDGTYGKNVMKQGVKERVDESEASSADEFSPWKICRRSERVFLKDSSPRVTVTAHAPLPSCLIQSLREDLAILFFKEGHFYESIVTEVEAPDVYGVKVKGERGTKPHIMSREELLNQAIQDVRVSSEALLAAGTRVCAYWSRKINCLYPAKVATNLHDDGHVLLQFDDGDSSRISLQDIKLIPQNWPYLDYDKMSTPELKGKRRKRRDSCHKLKSDHHDGESDGGIDESKMDVRHSFESELEGKDFKDGNTLEIGCNGVTKKLAKDQKMKSRVKENSGKIESSIGMQHFCVPISETKEINDESIKEKICGRVNSACKENVDKGKVLGKEKVNNKDKICFKGRSPVKEKPQNGAKPSCQKFNSKEKDRSKAKLSVEDKMAAKDVKYSENGMSKKGKGIEKGQTERWMPKLNRQSKNLVGKGFSEKLKLTRNLSKKNKSIIFPSKLNLGSLYPRQTSASTFAISACLSDAALSSKSGKGIARAEGKSPNNKGGGQQNALYRPTDTKKVCDISTKQELATTLSTEVSDCTRIKARKLTPSPLQKHDCRRQHLHLIDVATAEKRNSSVPSPSRGKSTKDKNETLSGRKAKASKKKEKQDCDITVVDDDDCNNDADDVEDNDNIEVDDDNDNCDAKDDDSESSDKAAQQSWLWCGSCTKRQGSKGRIKKRFYKSIMRDDQVVSIGDCAVFLSADRAHLPYVGRIESFWEGWGSSMQVRVSWFYHPEEMRAGNKLAKPRGALYQSPHMDDNDVQTISHKCQVISFPKYCELNAEAATVDGKVFYLAGHYDPMANRVTYETNVELSVIDDVVVDKTKATV